MSKQQWGHGFWTGEADSYNRGKYMYRYST